MDLANKEEWPSRKEGSEVVLKEGRKEGRRIQIPVRSLFQTRFRLFQTWFWKDFNLLKFAVSKWSRGKS